MNLSNKEKKRRQHEKELKSLRNKMGGQNIVWFDSLTKTKQYDLLFAWKREKSMNRLTKPVIRKVKRRVILNNRFDYQWDDVISYPANIKYFIKKVKHTYAFIPSVTNLRQSAIDLILK